MNPSTPHHHLIPRDISEVSFAFALYCSGLWIVTRRRFAPSLRAMIIYTRLFQATQRVYAGSCLGGATILYKTIMNSVVKMMSF